MKTNPFFVSLLALAAAVLMTGLARADTTGSVNQAFQTARQAVNADVQNQVVSIYGIGTPSTIQKWYIIFYDPTVPSHGRAVLVENDQVTKSYPANGGKIYSSTLAFDPSRITSETPALQAAQDYAARHAIAYDSVRALLRQKSQSKPFRWAIQLLDVGADKGCVYVNAIDDTVAYYKAPLGNDAGFEADKTAAGIANDVKHTFLGIGGDLQEFFTGERTVDK